MTTSDKDELLKRIDALESKIGSDSSGDKGCAYIAFAIAILIVACALAYYLVINASVGGVKASMETLNEMTGTLERLESSEAFKLMKERQGQGGRADVP